MFHVIDYLDFPSFRRRMRRKGWIIGQVERDYSTGRVYVTVGR